MCGSTLEWLKCNGVNSRRHDPLLDSGVILENQMGAHRKGNQCGRGPKRQCGSGVEFREGGGGASLFYFLFFFFFFFPPPLFAASTLRIMFPPPGETSAGGHECGKRRSPFDGIVLHFRYYPTGAIGLH